MWSTVELRELRVFLTLADELHFGRTAERLGLTQSRVSQTLRTLESKLGTRLFERTSRRVTVTDAGERLRADLAPIYEQLQAALERSSADARGLDGVLRLGVAHAAAVGGELLGAIEVFDQRHPACRIEIVDLPFLDRHGPVRRGEVDLMVTATPIEQAGITVGPAVGSEARVLAMARDHPLATRDAVSIEEIADYPVLDASAILPDELAGSYQPRVTPRGKPIEQVQVDVRDFSDLVILIARGRVVQPTVASAVGRFAHANVVCRPISDMPPVGTALAWRRGNADRRLHAFIEVIRARPGDGAAPDRRAPVAPRSTRGKDRSREG
jgi:DNA-binding transcriptional LysR family regulator